MLKFIKGLLGGIEGVLKFIVELAQFISMLLELIWILLIVLMIPIALIAFIFNPAFGIFVTVFIIVMVADAVQSTPKNQVPKNRLKAAAAQEAGKQAYLAGLPYLAGLLKIIGALLAFIGWLLLVVGISIIALFFGVG